MGEKNCKKISEEKEAMDPMDTASKKVDKYRHITEPRENYKQIFYFFSVLYTGLYGDLYQTCESLFSVFPPSSLLFPGLTCLFYTSALPPRSLIVK